MVKTWAANICPLYEEACYQSYYNRAPEFRKKKAERLRDCQARAQSIGVWTLYAQMKRAYGFQEDAVCNFSHSGDYVLCSVETDPAMYDVKIGCDIEAVKECNLRIARRFFCASEYEQLLKEKDEGRRRLLFYRYWVLKESFMKATRRGLGLGMDTFEIALSDPPVLLKQPEEFPEVYTYREFEIKDKEYKIAVCSTDPEIDSIVQVEFKWENQNEDQICV